MYRTAGAITSALCAALAGAAFTASAAQVEEPIQQGLGIFEAACFPNLDTLEIVEKRIATKDWKRAELGANPMLDQAVGNFLTAPDAAIQTISVDSFMLQDNSNTYFLIYRQSQANKDEMKQAINSCHVYDFTAKAGWIAKNFEIWRTAALLKYKYLNVRGALYISESEPAKRPKDSKLLTGIHFTASNFAPES
jgi:hypothetical protein